jgi:hypothetical protein
MSVTQQENERLRRDFDRANSLGWAEEKRRRVESVQRANPGMSFETAWNKVERWQENPAPEPTTLGEAAKLVHAQNPTWTFERSWNHAEAIYPDLVKSAAAEGNREEWGAQARVEAVARQLMAKEPGLPFGMALIRARGG